MTDDADADAPGETPDATDCPVPDVEVRDVLPRDAIPSVDDPQFVPDYAGPADDEVVAVEYGGEARAYPVRYLNYHEIVNDVIAGDPLAVTWCPLCGSAVVYHRRVVPGDEDDPDAHDRSRGPARKREQEREREREQDDDRDRVLELEFGVSGKLADDDLVMYDRETGSEWKQSLGVAIAGPLAGTALAVVPAGLTTWASFREGHPDGVVLAPPGGRSEAGSDDDRPVTVEYDDDPYESYVAGDGFGLGAHRGTGPGREWDRTDLPPKEPVLGLQFDGEAVGVPRSIVADAGGLVTTTVGRRRVLVVLGTDLHAYADPGVERTPADGDRRLRGDGATWNPDTGRSDDGRQLDRLPARRLFAFAWQDDHGPDSFYGLEG
jgi:hypothetical protein